MADNSDNRKKTLFVSVLAFLFIGGGVFLFFIIQGSSDLTGKGKNKFSYGEAAREGVSSFFKTLGVVPDREAFLENRKEEVLAAYGFTPDGKSADDLSDWMQNDSAAASVQAPRSSSAGSSVVPGMSKASLSQPGGGGGGSSKSSGSSSRFGGGDNSRAVSVSASAKNTTPGASGNVTLKALKNTRAVLGEGLRSGSAATASSKWGQSFGVGGSGGKSKELAYNSSGLVGLDKIKSGEIASLKMDKKGVGLAPEAGAFERDKQAESKDANLQAKNAEAKKNTEDEAKKAAAKTAMEELGKGMANTPKGATGENQNTSPTAPITEEENALARELTSTPLPLSEGRTIESSSVVISRNADGGATFNITGAVMPAPGSTEAPLGFTFAVVKNPDGSVTPGEFAWKAAP